jgi:hypothetical protein
MGEPPTRPNYATTEHRIAVMSSVIDVLMAVAVEFFHGDADLMWQRLGSDGKAVVEEWAGLRHFDATGQKPPHAASQGVEPQ